jgi:hypothetical protein
MLGMAKIIDKLEIGLLTDLDRAQNLLYDLPEDASDATLKKPPKRRWL